MSEIDLSTLINNLTIKETPVLLWDQEPDNNYHLKKIINNTNIVSNFFNTFHNVDVIKKFLNTNVFVFRIYLGLEMFTKKYNYVTDDFLLQLHGIKEGLKFFVLHYNENNIDFNMEFVRDFNNNLYIFIIHNYYETGFLL
jgi:hypothetical protein